jgi:hypothetical protein
MVTSRTYETPAPNSSRAQTFAIQLNMRRLMCLGFRDMGWLVLGIWIHNEEVAEANPTVRSFIALLNDFCTPGFTADGSHANWGTASGIRELTARFDQDYADARRTGPRVLEFGEVVRHVPLGSNLST